MCALSPCIIYHHVCTLSYHVFNLFIYSLSPIYHHVCILCLHMFNLITSHQSITMCALYCLAMFTFSACSLWADPYGWYLTPPPPHPQSTVPKDCRLPSPSPVKNIAEITANMLQKHSLLSKIPQPSTYYSSSAIFPIDNLTCVWNGKLLHFPRKNCWPPLHI